MSHSNSYTFQSQVLTTVNNVNLAGGMTVNANGEFIVEGCRASDLLHVVVQDANCMMGAWDTNEYIGQLAEDEIEGCDWNEFMAAVALCLKLDITADSY